MSAQPEQLVCINHHKNPTNLRCSSCNNPICTKCIRQSAVGMKCPDCARPALRARIIGRPRHYAAGAAVGFGSALVAGVILRFLGVGFFGFLVPIIVGYLLGVLVMRASARQKHSGIQLTAAAGVGLGLITAAMLTGGAAAATHPVFLFSALIAAGAAALAAGR